MHEKFERPYDPQDTESRIYEMWEKSELFTPEKSIEAGHTKEDADPYTIVLPPPNVTGVLHMGHASMLAIEDLMIRYNRMKGKKALWIPGTDSASIATQSVVEKKILKEEKKSRHDLGREELLNRIADFVEESKSTIISQIKAMGSSLDWTRYAFTMDESRTKAVNEAFFRMYEAGLIVRGNRVINWDPKGQTTISDDEVNHEETPGVLYTFTYSKDFPIPIATTRPETKVGDVAVAVHPEDKRYKKYIGETFEVTFAGVSLSIKIVGDEAVDPEFGTGAVGVTPAHSQIDFEIAERHNLPLKQVINEYAKMQNTTPELDGLKVSDARAKIVEWIESEGLLTESKEVTLNISRAERTNGIIEPLPKQQWFIDVNKSFTTPHSNIAGIKSGTETTLKELMTAAVEGGDVDILPERFNKIYFHWVNNLRPWCISRQIWYGHRIPMWYKEDELKAQVESPGEGWEQDPDTLDTWFSSGLWTLSTLGWPEKTKDLAVYHPTAVLETGHDIIFFWVARMILMTTFLTGDVPFKKVFLHGMVRDSKGAKMSKSKGNGIDPLDLVGEYGADATRFALLTGAAPGNDIPLDVQQVKGYRRFANKIWNVARFVLTHTEDADLEKKPELTEDDEKDIVELDAMVTEVTKLLEEYRFDLAADRVYHYFWHTFADIILEKSKSELEGDRRAAVQWKLYHILTTTLKTLHPFMPFVTEEIWQSLEKKDDPYLLVAKWPNA